MESKFTDEDKNWIDAGTDADDKLIRKNALLNLYEMNGLKFEPGIGKSYIPEKNYFQSFYVKGFPDTVNEAITNALNWDALGGGVGGLAGAGVRRGLIKFFDPSRETKLHSEFTAEIKVILKNYNDFTATRKDFIPFWAAQAFNVLGLAGAIFNREMHHWNADNIKPQQALMGSLNQTDSIPESEYRKLFYLSIHPIPLATMEKHRQRIVAGAVPGINDAVTSRCRAAPASCGDVHACAQAVPDIMGEPYYSKFGTNFRENIVRFAGLNNEIMANAAAYHSFAVTYGLERKIVDKVSWKRIMACLCAYIMVNIKGSLAQSAALRKFRSNNARIVQKWVSAFEKAGENMDLKLEDLASD